MPIAVDHYHFEPGCDADNIPRFLRDPLTKKKSHDYLKKKVEINLTEDDITSKINKPEMRILSNKPTCC